MHTTVEDKEERVKAVIDAVGGAKVVADGIAAFHKNMCELDDRTAELRGDSPSLGRPYGR